MMHTIISGIAKLADDAENTIRSISTIDYKQIQTEEELKNAFQNCDVFWFRLNHKITYDILEKARCKYILCAATGLDHIDIEACEKKQIQVIHLKGEKEFLKEVRATAEHTLGLLLSLIRKSKRAMQHAENGEWNRYLFQGTELYKKNVGILGMGRLGKIVADYYAVLGMQVYYYDIEDQDVPNSFIKTNSIKELCSSIDILSIHLPYNERTHEIVNTDILAALKTTAVIVNTARGGLVNEKHLLEYLLHKKIAGYATDVLYGEPNIDTHPLVQYALENENVIITPHIGGNTYESIEKTEGFIVDKLINILG